MKYSNRHSVLVLAVLAAAVHQGCSVEGFGDQELRSCPAPQTVGPHHGTRPDGRVDATARGAWPERGEEQRLTPAEVAEGCAAHAVCAASSASPTEIQTYFQSCLQGRVDILLSLTVEERAIPIERKNERLSFYLREAIAAKGDCTKIDAALTDAPRFLYCEEDGCISRQKREVTCDGDVAVFDDGTRRDCSRAYAECSADSETGCTDRRFSACENGAKDRCDGDVKLGCDGCGFVSFRDCGWNGGHCKESSGGAECVPPDRSACDGMNTACSGDGFDVCAFGEPVRLDCAAMGMKCSDTRFDVLPSGSFAVDHCVQAGLTAPCVLATCVPL